MSVCERYIWQEVFAAGHVVMIAAGFGDVHVDWLTAAFRAVVIVINILLNRLDANRDRARLHQRLHVPHYDIFGGPQVPELAVDDAAMIGCSHTLSMRFLWIDHEGARPEVHIVQNGASFDEASPVHVF